MAKIVHDMRMRIRVNSGEIVTGNRSTVNELHHDGGYVNLAARLEEAAKQYGIFIKCLCSLKICWKISL